MTTRHILIVDDEPKLTYSLRDVLKHVSRDYHVSVAHSGEEALDMLDDCPADLLMTDLCMPGISGLELIRRVRMSSPHTRTILITAYGNDIVEAKTRHLQVYRYIAKPFRIVHLLKVIQKALTEGDTSDVE
jgi:CheY-like chemotaxis protein